MERELVRIDGRSDELGRPYLYATTMRFLQVFGLQSLEKLPRRDQFAAGKLASPPERLDSTEPVDNTEVKDRQENL